MPFAAVIKHPDVVVRVKVDQAHLLAGVGFAVGAHRRRRDRVVAADHDGEEALGLAETAAQRVLDVGDALPQVEHRHGHVAYLADLERG